MDWPTVNVVILQHSVRYLLTDLLCCNYSRRGLVCSPVISHCLFPCFVSPALREGGWRYHHVTFRIDKQ